MSNHNHINWEEIRNKYIYGVQKDGKFEFPSTTDLASECDIARETISRRSTKENWAKARREYITERSQKSHEKVIEEISDEIVPFDTFLFKKVDQFVRGIGGMIDNLFPTVSKEEGQEPIKTSEIISVKTTDLLNIINSLRSAKELEEVVIGKGTGEVHKWEILVADEETKKKLEEIRNG